MTSGALALLPALNQKTVTSEIKQVLPAQAHSQVGQAGSNEKSPFSFGGGYPVIVHFSIA